MAKKRTGKSDTKRAANKPPRTNPSGPPVEAFAALDSWAADVAECLSDDDLGVLVGIYRRIAGDRRVSADNRRLAQRQAAALRKFRK